MLLVIILLVDWGGKHSKSQALQIHGRTMGTSYTVKLLNLPNDWEAVKTRQAIAKILDQLHTQMSTYNPNSEISKFNTSQSTDWFPVSKDMCAIVAESLRISKLTDGAFDITVGPLVNLWGFGAKDTHNEPPSKTTIEAAMRQIGYQYLQARCDGHKPIALRKTKPNIQISLAAIAQGYGADRVADYLDRLGVQDYLVDVGGELRGHGVNAYGKSWRIGIQRPIPGSYGEAERIVHIKDCALATSGTYRNFFTKDSKNYSHTIDPKTGMPVTHNLVSVTIMTSSAAVADALATALSVLGPKPGYNLAIQQEWAVIFMVQDAGKLRIRVTPKASQYLN